MTAVIVIVGILSALLIRVAIGAIPFIAGGHCKKKTPATLEETKKIVEAKIEEPVASHIVQSASVPTVTVEKPKEQLQVPVTANAPQFFEERAADQQVQMVAEKMSGSSLNSARRVQSTMHSSHHPRTN